MNEIFIFDDIVKTEAKKNQASNGEWPGGEMTSVDFDILYQNLDEKCIFSQSFSLQIAAPSLVENRSSPSLVT